MTDPITLARDEARVVIAALRFEADCYEGKVYRLPASEQWQFDAARTRRALADRLEASL